MDGPRIREDTAFCRDYLLRVANGVGVGTAVPLAGSATCANEAMIQTLVPATGKLLVYSNGVFGDRLGDICAALGQPYNLIRAPSTQPLSTAELQQALVSDAEITHVIVVHCETSTGITNPIEDIADLCGEWGKGLLIDAVSSFGVLGLDMRRLGFEGLAVGSNKALHGPPGLAWVIADEEKLKACKGRARSLSLDLWDQWQCLERSGCFRFTPPTHVLVAFAQALREHEKAGGWEGRFLHCQRNRRCLVAGMRALGFETLLAEEVAAPILATFHPPDDPRFDPLQLCRGMERAGFRISLGRIAIPNTIRVGCIGALDSADMAAVVSTVGGILDDMGVAVGGACDALKACAS